MNQQKQQTAEVELAQLESLVADDLLAAAYKDSQDFEAAVIREISVATFSRYFKRMIRLFRDSLSSGKFPLIPFQYNYHNEFGAGNLQSDFQNLRTNIANGDFLAAEPYLLRLVYYLSQHGLWEVSAASPNTEKYSHLIDEAELLSAKTRANQNDAQTLNTQLVAERENLTVFIANKQKELEQITALLQAARTNSDEIQRLHTSSTENNQAIIGLLNLQTASLDESQKKAEIIIKEFQTTTKQFDDLESKFEGAIQHATTRNSDFDKLLLEVADKSKSFEDRLAILNELIGKEGAVRLFQTFNDRKNELKEPVNKWTWIVFVTSVAALTVIVAIFTNIFGLVGGTPNTSDWHFLVVNSIKSLPVMAVLAFAIRQYVRERNFQEEYAFRSAIALTVQAYGDIAGTRKEELVMQAVANIYSLPSTMKGRVGSTFSLRNRGLNEILREMNETIKSMKN